MTSITPIKLGALLDNWANTFNVGIIESADTVTISRLDATLAGELFDVCEKLEWKCHFENAAQEPVTREEMLEAMGPYVATLEKATTSEYRCILTQAGLSKALHEKQEGIWQIAFAILPFSSGTVSFQPWGSSVSFSASHTKKSPLELVRDTNAIRHLTDDVRTIISSDKITDQLWEDPAFKIFAEFSAPRLIQSIASELNKDNSLTFMGPPRLNISLCDDFFHKLTRSAYQNLKLAVEWVYEDTTTAEQRHALLTAEIARSANRNEKINDIFNSAGKEILEGARLAFQLSQSDLSREAIKAQSDLRKSIADDTAKAAEGTRSLAGAIAVAIATAITLIATRSTGSVEPWVLGTVALIVAIYLAVIAISGWSFLCLQHRLRTQWRNRFYRFIPQDDYHEMVTKPARSGELPYHLVASMAVVISFALAVMAIVTFLTKEKQEIELFKVNWTDERPLILNDINPAHPLFIPNSNLD